MAEYEEMVSKLDSASLWEGITKAPSTLEKQLLSSQVILELVKEAVSAKQKNSMLQAAIIDEIGSISISDDTPVKITRSHECDLRNALARIGQNQTVLGRSERGEGFTAYKVYTAANAEEPVTIRIFDEIMQNPDPVEAIADIAYFSIHGVARTKNPETADKELMDVFERMGIKHEDLTSRMLVYEGTMSMQGQVYNQFTYEGANMKNTMQIPASAKGDELLDILDHRIIEMHNLKGTPYVRPVLEKFFGGMSTNVDLERFPENTRMAVKIIDYMKSRCIGNQDLSLKERREYEEEGIEMTDIQFRLLPADIQKVYLAIKDVMPPKPAIVTKEEMKEFTGALDLLHSNCPKDSTANGICPEAMQKLEYAASLLITQVDKIPAMLENNKLDKMDANTRSRILLAFIEREITRYEMDRTIQKINE